MRALCERNRPVTRHFDVAYRSCIMAWARGCFREFRLSMYTAPWTAVPLMRARPEQLPKKISSARFAARLFQVPRSAPTTRFEVQAGAARKQVPLTYCAPLIMTLVARLRSAPFTLALATSTVKTAAADVMTQKYIEGADTIDLNRLGTFTVFGFYYLGAFQYFLYVRCFRRWFPAAEAFGEHATLAARLRDLPGLRDLAAQVAVGNFLHIPFAFLPSFYLTQEVTTHGLADASPANALTSWQTNLWSDCVSAWAIWVPGHAIFFSVPLWLRLPVNHAMSFAYVCVLSAMRGQGEKMKEGR